MKLHKDGTVEGTPEEIAEYNRLAYATVDSLDCALVGALHELNKRACSATDSEQHKKIISEAAKVRSLIQLQKEHWKNRKPEDRPKVSYADALQKASFMSGMKVKPNEWGEIVPDRDETLAEQKAIEDVYAQIKDHNSHSLQGCISTKELSKQLESRTGVEVHKIAPRDEYSLIIGSVRHDRTGPATILINED